MTRSLIALLFVVGATACGNHDTELTGDAVGGAVDDGGTPINPNCVQLEATCGSDFDCCSDRCHAGECLPAGSCLAAATTCDPTKADACCSGRCEPVEGKAGVTECADLCRADGVACTKATDCCDLDCNGTTCGGDECQVEGNDCTGDADCCSNICTGSKCQLDPANTTCRGTGETCNSGPQQGCCSMVCDVTINPPRCDLGSDTCGAQNATCTVDGDCCHGVCNPTAHVCQTPCTDTNGTCTTGADCCSSICIAGACAAPPMCSPVGTACTTGDACCSGICNGGFCDQIIF